MLSGVNFHPTFLFVKKTLTPPPSPLLSLLLRSPSTPFFLAPRYLFSDGKSSYAAYENPPFSGSFPDPPDKLRLFCSKNSPVDCPETNSPNGQIDVGQVFSLGQANNLTLYMFTATGVYRMVSPALCNHACDQPFPPPPAPPARSISPPFFTRTHPHT